MTCSFCLIVQGIVDIAKFASMKVKRIHHMGKEMCGCVKFCLDVFKFVLVSLCWSALFLSLSVCVSLSNLCFFWPII